MNASVDRDPLLPRPADGLGRGALLALAVHGLLLLALAAGVQWRRSTPEAFSAELWAALPQQAAPRPAPAPEPPAPQPAPAPAASPPPPPARREADIALERQRELQRERERQAEIERQKARERELARQKEREAADRKRREQEAALLAQQRELQKQRQAELKRQQEEARREEARQAAALEKQRQENLRRMMGQAGATGAPSATGSAARDAGPSASYGGRIVAAVKPNIVLTDPLPASLEAEVEVRASPTGTILARRLVRSSGNPTWDDAVLRAIDRTRQLPTDVDGRVPSTIVIRFRPE